MCTCWGSSRATRRSINPNLTLTLTPTLNPNPNFNPNPNPDQVEQLVRVVSNLGQTVSTLAHENQLLRDQVKVLASKMPEISAALGNVQQLLTADVQATLEKLKGMLAAEAAGGDEREATPVTPVHKVAKSPRRTSPSRRRADVDAAATAAHEEEQEEEQEQAAAATSSPLNMLASAGASSSSPATSTAAATTTSAFGGLSQSKAVPLGPVESLKGKTAAVLFMNFMASGGSLPNLLPADVTRANMVCEQYKAFATEEELKVMRPPYTLTQTLTLALVMRPPIP